MLVRDSANPRSSRRNANNLKRQVAIPFMRVSRGCPIYYPVTIVRKRRGSRAPRTFISRGRR